MTGDQNNPFDTSLSGVAEIPAGSSFDYSVDNLSAGQYAVIGYSDVNGNGSTEDANDYVGIYPLFGTLVAVSPPATDIDFPMITNAEFGALSVQGTTRTKVFRAARTSLNSYLLKSQLERTLKTVRQPNKTST